MINIDKLIRKYGDANSIPEHLLRKAGYRRTSNGTIKPIKERNESGMLSQVDDYEDLLKRIEVPDDNDEIEKEAVSIWNKKERENKKRIKQELRIQLNGPASQYLSPEEKVRFTQSVRSWYSEHKNEEIMETSSITNYIPDLRFLRSLNQALEYQLLEVVIAPEILKDIIDEQLNSSEQDLFSEPEILTDLEIQSSTEALRLRLSRRRNMSLENLASNFHPDNIPANIEEQYEKEYGPSDFCGGVPFRSYAFQRMLLNVPNPLEFWGMRLHRLYEHFIERYKDIPNIKKLADFIYNEGASLQAESIFSGEHLNRRVYNKDEYSEELDEHLTEILSDSLPTCVEEFEENSVNGVAKSLIGVEYYYIDDEFLHRSDWLRDVLVEIHKREFPHLFERKKPSHFSYLEDVIKSESKRLKVMRLCSQNPDFDQYVQEFTSGNTSYIDNLPQNVLTTQELQALGVDTKTFYEGIAPLEFVVEAGVAQDIDSIKNRFLGEYKASLEQMLSGDTVHRPNVLQKKIIDALTKKEKLIPEETDQRVYLMNLEDEESLQTVCRTCSEYASRQPNVKDKQQTAAAIHHFRNLGNFFKGKKIELRDSKEESKNISDKYTIKVSRKDPIKDIDIGNDGGCCIGIYDSQGDVFEERHDFVNRFIEYLDSGAGYDSELPDVEPNGCYMPFYLKDRATHFIEIYRGKDRVGMALMFAGKNENNEPLLVVNSIENSEKLKKDKNLEKVLEKTAEYIRDFQQQSGFDYALMAQHSYNPGKSASSDVTPEFSTITKIDHWNEEFYSDIFSNNKATTKNFRIV